MGCSGTTSATEAPTRLAGSAELPQSSSQDAWHCRNPAARPPSLEVGDLGSSARAAAGMTVGVRLGSILLAALVPAPAAPHIRETRRLRGMSVLRLASLVALLSVSACDTPQRDPDFKPYASPPRVSGPWYGYGYGYRGDFYGRPRYRLHRAPPVHSRPPSVPPPPAIAGRPPPPPPPPAIAGRPPPPAPR